MKRIISRMRLTLSLSILLLATASQLYAQTERQSIAGNWEGTLVVGVTKLRLLLKISATNGKLTATLDSLDQANANNLAVDVIAFEKGTLHFEMKKLLITYDGTLSKDGIEILGTFAQGGSSQQLILHKQGKSKLTLTVLRGRIQMKSCSDPSLTSDSLCGTYEVFEDRQARSGRKLSLNIVILPATNSPAAPDPVFYLAGGPGGAATAYAPDKFMNGLRRNRDVVLVDQRGTGKSNPLNCAPVGTKEDMRGFFGEPFSPERIRACRVELEKIADLKLYTSSIAMDDLDEVRGALGYDRINVYGGSYGSTVALVYLRQHGEHVRTVAIFGVAPLSAKIPLSFAKGVQDAVDRLFADCAADAQCHKAYPALVADFQKVLALFVKGPVEVVATNAFTLKDQKVTVTRDAFVDSVRQLLYVPDAAAALPALIHLGSQGNLGPLISVAFQVIAQIDNRISRGMQFSVICAEDIPFITPEEVKSTSANSFYGDARVRPTIRACGEWPQAKVPISFLDPVKSDVPVLLIAGELDPVTPPWLAEEVVKTLSHGLLIKVHNATHNSYDCIESLVADFIDKGKTEGLDASCVEQIKRPAFLVMGSP